MTRWEFYSAPLVRRWMLRPSLGFFLHWGDVHRRGGRVIFEVSLLLIEVGFTYYYGDQDL